MNNKRVKDYKSRRRCVLMLQEDWDSSEGEEGGGSGGEEEGGSGGEEEEENED